MTFLLYSDGNTSAPWLFYCLSPHLSSPGNTVCWEQTSCLVIYFLVIFYVGNTCSKSSNPWPLTFIQFLLILRLSAYWYTYLHDILLMDNPNDRISFLKISHLYRLTIVLLILLLFIYFWLLRVSVAAHGALSSCGEWGLLSSFNVQASLLWWAFLLPSTDSGVPRLSSCFAWVWLLWHAESSWIRDPAHIPHIGRCILDHWATREVLQQF